MTNKPNFDVCIIVKNEALTLPRMLNSLQEFKDRGGIINIVDTNSTDDTVKVAETFGCKVFTMGDKFRKKINAIKAKKINEMFIIDGEEPIVKAGDTFFHYSAARNYAADMASNDWVWEVDADEQATVLNLDEIEKVISNPNIHRLEYNFCFSKDAFGNDAIAFMHSKMYRRDKMKWVHPIHEVLQNTEGGETRGFYVGPNILKLDHYQNPKSERSHYLMGLAIDCFERPDDDRASHYFGRELYYKGRYKSAIKELTRHVAMNKWQTERSQSLLFIGDSYMMLGMDKEGLAAYNEAFAIDSTRREPFMRLADYYYRKKDHQRVAAYCEAAITIPNNRFYSNHQELYTYKPHELAYWAYWWLGNKEKSKEHYLKALNFVPNHPKFQKDAMFYFEYTKQDISGWMTLEELNFLYETAKKCNTILEIGSWQGRSTHALLSGCKGTVTAVDTFEGSDDVKDLTYKQGERLGVFDKFKQNTAEFKNLEVHKMTSEEAAQKFKDCKWDMIFIDANHTYEGVKKDIELWKDKAIYVLAGHDYTFKWLGVQKAVDETIGDVKLADSIWYRQVSFPKERIPKKIFTCWLGKEMPELVKKCIQSQKIEGYEHHLITLENLPDLPYIKQCLNSPHKDGIKYTKATDYLRMYYLLTEGGIFLDADVEILSGKNFDKLLKNRFFAGMEKNKEKPFVGSAVIGSEPNHPFVKKWKDEVDAKFRGDDDKCFESSMYILTTKFDHSTCTLYPSDYFYPYSHQLDDVEITPNTITYHHFTKTWKDEEYPMVSIIIPQLGREEGLKRCLASIKALNYPQDKIETLIYDGDGTVPEKVARGYKEAKADLIVFAANDMTFAPDTLRIAVNKSKEFGLVAFHEEPYREGNRCTHFLIRRDLVEKIGGEIFDTRYHHVGVDQLLWAKCDKLKEAYHCVDAKIIHYHFSNGNAGFDEINSVGWNKEKVEHDRNLLKKDLEILYAK
jgi:glycosyltransferase involved in cell wall biosynthesis